ncbi:hypothetical protein H0H93_008722 [Arthromyces matolae]|nr:hypothetical protein H0H93_008722 [Arthromyces matolae]
MMAEPALFHTLPLSSMSVQQPTLRNVRIRSVRDAIHVFYAVATQRLPLITRRLDAEERRAIGPGNVYVWEERGANTEPTGLGMERWTDGMGWGPSRVRDEFLFYNQKDPSYGEEIVDPVTPWAQMMRKREQPMAHNMPSSQAERLVKQTYSVYVTIPSDSPRGMVRKWHLTAYFNQQRLYELGTIDNVRGVVDVLVPEGLFRSARLGKTRRDHRGSVKRLERPIASGHSESSNSRFDSVIEPPRARSRGSSPVAYTCTTFSSRFSDNSRECSPSSESSRQVSGTSLVPLEYLQNITAPRRNPADEQLLRRFTGQTVGSTF